MLVIGNYVSPYVRKVLIVLGLKGIDYQIDPIVPFFGNDEFSRLSPLRRIPVLIDGDLVINDSTIICEYLDEIQPEPRLLPTSPAERARARWIEEYCDSRMGDVLIWKLFFQRVVGPGVFRRPTDEALVQQALDEEIPQIMNWLEAEAPASGFVFGAEPGIADIAPACFLRNAALAGWTPDPQRWPRAAAWIDRVQALPEFAAMIPLEQIILTSRVAEQRERLRAAGAPLATTSLADTSPRQSIMGVDRS